MKECYKKNLNGYNSKRNHWEERPVSLHLFILGIGDKKILVFHLFVRFESVGQSVVASREAIDSLADLRTLSLRCCLFCLKVVGQLRQVAFTFSLNFAKKSSLDAQVAWKMVSCFNWSTWPVSVGIISHARMSNTIRAADQPANKLMLICFFRSLCSFWSLCSVRLSRSLDSDECCSLSLMFTGLWENSILAFDSESESSDLVWIKTYLQNCCSLCAFLSGCDSQTFRILSWWAAVSR